MDVIKQFIEEHIPKMDTPEKVYQLFVGLGYKTLDTSYEGMEASGIVKLLIAISLISVKIGI